MKCWPLDMRHLQRDGSNFHGFGEEGEPAFSLTTACGNAGG